MSFLSSFFANIPIYIINLNDSIDRKTHILNEFKDYSSNIHFIEAVDGRDPEYFNNNYIIKYETDIDFTTALIAVICSHAKAIYKAYHSGLDKVCIFEDDVHLDLIYNCKFTLDDVCKLNNDWETIQLFYAQNIEDNHNDYLNNGLRLIKRDSELNYSGTCYIINRNGMEKFLNNVIITDGTKNFNIIPKIIDPEAIVFNYINSYIINRILFYYWFNSMTFNNYLITDVINNTTKIGCQQLHLNIKNKLLELYTE